MNIPTENNSARRNQTMFTWVPFYRELAVKILEFREAQLELIGMLKELKSAPHNIPIIQLNDKDLDGNAMELTEIDPFTFFASFNRGLKDENSLAILKFLKERLSIQAELPSDFNGIPVVDKRNSWFFLYLFDSRRPDDIAKLWDLAQAVTYGGPEVLSEGLFARCLEIKQVGMPKLTMGMFWFNAPEYLALDSKMKTYFASHGIKLQESNLASYCQMIEQVHEKLGNNHPQISYDAWKFSPKNRYWAGGHSWDDESQLERFKRDNLWQNGFKRGEPKGEKSWQHFDQIQIGDEFAIKGANFGKVKIYYVCRVTGKQEADGILTLAKLDREPLYNGKAKWGQEAGAWNTTLLEVTRPDIIQKIFHPKFDGDADNSGEEDTDSSMKNYPLNQILYGPPGTGKTYNSIERAVKIIDSKEYATRKEAKAQFDELRREGRIGFVTFHQSFSYEDFVEGIRPVMDESTQAGAHYECRDGVLKSLALKSIGAGLRPLETGSVSFVQLWENFVQKVEDDPEWLLPGLGPSEYQISFTSSGNAVGENVKGHAASPYNAPRRIVEQVWEELEEDVKPSHNILHEIIGKGAHTNLIGAIVEELRRLEKISSPSTTIKQDPTDAALAYLRGSNRYELLSRENQPRYVLIIDEINRGNISKILGELITLLEPDKRLGADNVLPVTLPYSGESFILPPNLYIIGTMNTADKSLALLDVALRRRFKFEEFPPKFEVCKKLPVAILGVLRTLNERIVLGKDRDHRIGHSFFMDVENTAQFNDVFRFEIIPLLQEYFYNDWDGLRFVLGESGDNGQFIRKLETKNLKDKEKNRVRNRWQWFFDDSEELDCLAALMKNYAPSAGAPQAGSTPGAEDDAEN